MACEKIGLPFIWDGVASELHHAFIVSINNTGFTRPSGSGVELETDAVFRNPEQLFLGARQAPVLSFPLEIAMTTERDTDVYEFVALKDWLFGSTGGYHRLQVCADYLSTFYFDCRLIAGEDYIFQGGYKAVSLTVECSSPWAYSNQRIKTYSAQELLNLNGIFTFHNLSADPTLQKPVIEFQIGSGGGGFSMTNLSFQNREFAWTNLQGGEIITVDNKTEIITSSTGLRRLGNFNKKFFRFVKGKNIIECVGHINYVKFTYKNAIRLGGGFYDI